MHPEQRNKIETEMLSMRNTFQSVETNQVEMQAERYVIGFTILKTIRNKIKCRRYDKGDCRRMP